MISERIICTSRRLSSLIFALAPPPLSFPKSGKIIKRPESFNWISDHIDIKRLRESKSKEIT